MKSLVLSSLAVFTLVGTSSIAGAIAPSAKAQSAPTATPSVQQGNAVLRATLEPQDTLYLNKDKTYDYDLILRSASAIGNQRLPVGTVIRGRFEPAEGGLVYVANSVEIASRIYAIEANSELLRDRKDPRQTSTGAILTDAAIGAAGGYILGEVLGKPDLWEVAGGAAAGVLVGNTTSPRAVVIRPEDTIMLFAN